MRKLLNTLYVTTPDCYLSLDGQNVVFLQDSKQLFRVPILNLQSIVCFNYLGISPKLMQYCTDNDVAISFISSGGRFLAGVHGKIRGNVVLRKKQCVVSEDENFCLNIAKKFIISKLYNSRLVLQRRIRDSCDCTDITAVAFASNYLKDRYDNVDACTTLDELRGVEGDAAKIYFSVFNDLILKQKDDFIFQGRTRRPPLDYVNAMLSFGYTLLAHDIQAALETVGLDSYVGFFHTDRSGRISLALDIMEEFRAIFVDKFVLSLINLKMINAKCFIKKESDGILMTDDARKLFLEEWQKRKLEIIEHPFLKEKVEIGLLPYIQALLLARFLRGELDDYPPYFGR